MKSFRVTQLVLCGFVFAGMLAAMGDATPIVRAETQNAAPKGTAN